MHEHLLNRREALRLSLGSLLSLGLWPSALPAAEGSSENFRFLVINDTHYMSPECGAWLEKAVLQMKKSQAEFCLLAGDLSDHGTKEELGPLREIFSKLGIPLHVQIGNHDYASPTDRKVYEELFPRSLNYSFNHGAWQFVALDTSEGQKFENTQIQPPTFAWLKEELPKLDRKRPMVVMTHFPLGTVQYRPRNADELLEHFRDFNLRTAFCGHFHGFTEGKRGEAVLLTNRCCALKRGNHDKTPEKGYFVCTVESGKLTREFIEVKAA